MSNLIKIKSKKPKNKNDFDELSFMNNHVDTFYIGLNDVNNKLAQNPKQAELVPFDKAEQVVKDWIHPDTQLMKSTLKITNKKQLKSDALNNSKVANCSLSLKRKTHYKSLKFVSDQKTSLKPNMTSTIKPKKSLVKILDDLFKTPEKHEQAILKETQTLVNDTPEQYYGLSSIERLKRKLDF